MKVLKETQKFADNVLTHKYGFATLGQFAGIGASKVMTEKLLMKTPVGNSTFKSSIVKIISAFGVDYVDYKITGGKRSFIGKSLSGGLVSDGIEDGLVKGLPYAKNFISKILNRK